MPESENALWAKTRRRNMAANRAERERRRKVAQTAAAHAQNRRRAAQNRRRAAPPKTATPPKTAAPPTPNTAAPRRHAETAQTPVCAFAPPLFSQAAPLKQRAPGSTLAPPRIKKPPLSRVFFSAYSKLFGGVDEFSVLLHRKMQVRRV